MSITLPTMMVPFIMSCTETHIFSLLAGPSLLSATRPFHETNLLWMASLSSYIKSFVCTQNVLTKPELSPCPEGAAEEENGRKSWRAWLLGHFLLLTCPSPPPPPFPYWWSRDKLGLIKTNHPLRCLFSHTCFPTLLGSFLLTDSIYSLRSALVPPLFYKMLQFSLANRTGHTNPNKLCPPLKGKAQTLESDKSEIKSQGPSLTRSSTVEKLLNRPHLQNEGNAYYF